MLLCGSCVPVMIFFVLFVGIIAGCDGKFLEGHLVTHENWAFVARFCFLSEHGEFRYEIEYALDSGPVNLLMYYDTEDQWPSVYRTNKTCKEKEAVLSINNSQIVNLTTSFDGSGCGRIEAQSVKTPAIIRCVRARRFRTARERWWFIAVSNCNATKGLNVVYKFTMTNGATGDYWHEHFSADEFYILPILLAYILAYLFLIMAVIMCTVELKARQFFHATYKLYIVSVCLQELGIMAQAIAYIRYAVRGVGYPRIKNFGRLSEAASEICFLLLLLLLAKGYTVTRGRLRLGSSIKLTIFTCVYVVITLCLFMYEREYFDPGEVLYLYESPAGYGIITLRIIAWWMFIYSTVFTLKHYPEKAAFYYPFNLIGTLWFVAGPGFILAANNLIDKWVRESVVYGAMHFISFSGHILFLVLTMPSKANKNFPYHVRTNQIGVMEISGTAGNNSIYHFGHHNYEPQTARTVPIDLFTVSKQIDLDVDFETNPFPHAIEGYTQTILVPFRIRDNDGSQSDTSEEVKIQEERVPGARSAELPRPPVSKPDRQIVSAGAPRLEFLPSAPSEEDLKGSASTMSAGTAERLKNAKIDPSVHKLTEMFLAQSLKQPD